ncbi:MAG: SUMF1/EgtB/PvdO family nonheme iron enzyme [Verrucomicrobiia bacterium]
MKFRPHIPLVLLLLGVTSGWGRAADTVVIPVGEYTPLIRSQEEPKVREVPAFRLDVHPVTNAEFLDFVTRNPQWRRSQVDALFADELYLAHWADDLEPGPNAPLNAPVLQISWFAVRAFAAERGGRIPSIAEWERVASVGIEMESSRRDPIFAQRMSAWFSRPTEEMMPDVMADAPNLGGA